MCFPVDVVVYVILPIVVGPRVIFDKGVGAPGVEMAGRDWAATILLTEVVGVYAGIGPVSPAVAVITVPVLVPLGSGVAYLIAGVTHSRNAYR